jgi:hypothetical protein
MYFEGGHNDLNLVQRMKMWPRFSVLPYNGRGLVTR